MTVIDSLLLVIYVTACLRILISQDLECNVSLVDDNRQEWVFTLYDFDNSGKVTKEVKKLHFMYFSLAVLQGRCVCTFK